MTTSFAPLPASTRRGSSPLVAAIVGVVGIVAALTLIVAGLTFVGLAIAFPIAVPIAESHGLRVSVHDVELARQFAQFAWVFGALAVASFTSAVAVLVAVVRAVSPAARD
jgi:hypothetical protein